MRCPRIKVEEALMKRQMSLFLVTSLWLTGCAFTAAVRPPSGLAEAAHAERSSEQTPRYFARVRSEHEVTRRLLAEGYRRSPTFRRLVDIIEQSDLLVYVFRHITEAQLGGHVQVMGEANGTRIVFIFINPNLASVRAITMMAHELQHAVEIANARDVVDHESLVRHYERIGTRDPWNGERYDTAAARAIETAVLAELTHSDRTPVTGPASGITRAAARPSESQASGDLPTPSGQCTHTGSPSPTKRHPSRP